MQNIFLHEKGTEIVGNWTIVVQGKDFSFFKSADVYNLNHSFKMHQTDSSTGGATNRYR